MSFCRGLLVSALVVTLLTPSALYADDGDPPWGADTSSPTDAVALQSAAHRLTGQSDTNEAEAVAQVYELLQAYGLDADTATQVAAQHALSIEAAKKLKDTRRRRNGLRRVFGKIPILRNITDGLWRLIGRGGRKIVRGASPDLTDLAFAVLTGGGSAVKILFRSRLKAVKRVLIEDAAGRLLARGLADGGAPPATEEGYVWTLTSADFTTHPANADQADPGFGFFDWVNYDPLWDAVDVYNCPGFALTINEFNATIALGIETTTLSGSFDGSGETQVNHPDPVGPTASTRASGSFSGTFTAFVPDWAAPGDLYFVGEGAIQAESSIDAVCQMVVSDGSIGTRSVSRAEDMEGTANIIAELKPNDDNTVLEMWLTINGCQFSGHDEPCAVVWVASTALGIPEE